MSTRPLRMFVAVDAPYEVNGRAAAAIDQLRAADADVKWINPEFFHLTLKFLGDVPMLEIDDVCRSVRAAVKSLSPFEVTLCGVGAFPNPQKPRTIWLGLATGAEEMKALANAVDEGLGELGFPSEPRAFRPHLTLGRVRRTASGADRLRPYLAEMAEFDAGTLYVDSATVYSSELARRGPKYTAIDHAYLGG